MKTFVFKVLQKFLPRYITYTCPKLWQRVHSATQWTASLHTLHMPKGVKTFVFKVQFYGMGCFGTYFTHSQRCENLRVQSATEKTASVHILRMPKAVMTFMFQSGMEWAASVHTLHMPKAVITFVFSPCYGMDCFGKYLTHAEICDNVRVHNVTQHMPKFKLW